MTMVAVVARRMVMIAVVVALNVPMRALNVL
jgi:hypothetical protein